jgi:hypothetical protein
MIRSGLRYSGLRKTLAHIIDTQPDVQTRWKDFCADIGFDPVATDGPAGLEAPREAV